jgi:hypothetical protein
VATVVAGSDVHSLDKGAHKSGSAGRANLDAFGCIDRSLCCLFTLKQCKSKALADATWVSDHTACENSPEFREGLLQVVRIDSWVQGLQISRGFERS